MTSTYDEPDTFDEVAWNDKRVDLEEALQGAAWELIEYMGTKHFTISDALDEFIVMVRPKEPNESID